MTLKRNVVKRSFLLGEISDDYRASLDSSLLQNAVMDMTNFMPIRSGGVKRRPSTQMIGGWEASNLDGEKQHVFRKRDGTYVLILAGTTTIKQMSLSTGTISNIGTLTNAPGLQAVQAGPSLFMGSSGSSQYVGISRVLEDSTGDLDIEGPGGTDGELIFYVQLRGLWDHDNAVAAITAVASDPNAILDEELTGFVAPAVRGLFGTELERISAAASRTAGTLAATLNNSFGGSKIAVHIDDWTGPSTIHDKNLQGNVIGWHQNRLVIADSTAFITVSERAVRLTMSQAGNPFVILPGHADLDDPIDMFINVSGGSRIYWTKSIGKQLYVGVGNSIVLFPGDPIGPENAHFNLSITNNASIDCTPTQDNENLYFVGEDSGALLAVRFDEISEVTKVRELSRYAYHLIPAVDEMAINYPSSYDPVKRLYLLQQGQSSMAVASFVNDNEDAPPAFCTFEMAALNGETVSIKRIIPVGVDVFAIVERSSNNDRALVKFTDSSAVVGDFYKEVSGANQTSWASGNTLVYSQYVWCKLLDNGVHVWSGLRQVSAGGTITTPVAGDTLYYALPFTSTMTLFDLPTEDFQGPSDHRSKRVLEHRLYVKDTKQVYINEIPCLPSMPTGPTSELPNFTGVVSANRLNWERETNIVIQAALGLPCTILSASAEVEI